MCQTKINQKTSQTTTHNFQAQKDLKYFRELYHSKSPNYLQKEVHLQKRKNNWG